MRDEEKTDSFSSFVRRNLGHGTLRDYFYGYITAGFGTLPEDMNECKKEIDAGIAAYLEYYKDTGNREYFKG